MKGVINKYSQKWIEGGGNQSIKREIAETRDIRPCLVSMESIVSNPAKEL